MARKKPKNIAKDDPSRTEFLYLWKELQVIVESIDIDALKSITHGNKSAGKRFRRGIRLLKTNAHILLMQSVELDKQAIQRKRQMKEK